MAAIQFEEDSIMGALKTNAAHGVLAAASSIYDRKLERFQSDINKELSELIGHGDYTLDFNLYAEQVSEVVMFKRTIGELHLINVETIKYQINDGTVAEIPLRDETTNEETGEVTYGDLKTSLKGDELITPNSALNSETTPFRLTWTITRTTAGQPAAIGVLYKETDTMS